jgi:hypothetical protein
MADDTKPLITTPSLTVGWLPLKGRNSDGVDVDFSVVFIGSD